MNIGNFVILNNVSHTIYGI